MGLGLISLQAGLGSIAGWEVYHPYKVQACGLCRLMHNVILPWCFPWPTTSAKIHKRQGF